MTIWDHLFPPFDAWWPNIIASVVWGTPAFLAQHWALRRAHRRQLREELAEQSRSDQVDATGPA